MKPDRRMLYLMHIDWRWITQRSHFLAMRLSRYFDVRVAYNRSWKRGILNVSDPFPIKTFPIYSIPFAERMRLTKRIKLGWNRIYVRLLILLARPDVIWVTFPEFAAALPKENGALVVYDCMDDYMSNTEDPGEQAVLCREEAALLKRADKVFVSSARLASVLRERYGTNREFVLVRNAFGGHPLPASRGTPRPKTPPWRLCFFGAVGPWIDFSAVTAALAACPDIEVHLFGPADLSVIPPVARLFCHGIVKHSDLPAATAGFDCFILPFAINDLTLSADPVKLYEYINLDKPIICVRYPEVERFAAFVDFYQSPADFVAAVERLRSAGFRPKYSEQERVEFLNQNSWDSRLEQVVRELAVAQQKKDRFAVSPAAGKDSLVK